MKPPAVSVSLCTYNGAKFLSEQLASIAAQTRPPEELVLSDDGSTDGTIEIAEKFARGASFQVRILRQPVNLKVTQNFAAALAACRGEIIALCDQDDVWLPGKLAGAERFLDGHPRCLAVFSDATVVDESLQPIGTNPGLWHGFGLTVADLEQLRDPAQALSLLARRFVVTGATLVIRRELLATVLPVPHELPRKFIHDGWIALIAAALAGLDFLPQPTLLYRQHAGQQVGVRQAMVPEPFHGSRRYLYRQIAEHSDNIIACLQERLGPQTAIPGIAEVAQRAAHFRCRADLPAGRLRRLWPVTCELASRRYHRNSRWPLLSVLRDLTF
jgi:glycosyltransferase involved in cell wall biosynthesis